MHKAISERIVSVAILVAIASLFVVNVSAIAAPSASEGDFGFKLEYVANGVWHCSDSGEVSCDTESSHVWIEEN
ncbi:MAG: hypothetical protein A3H96_23700 [Acidobacteria bacterium RIFCSPLOWO2_02_FULL_67_36]|nr:MAG: hypothetical protein A3H96_23700 [Acidobacteria bacterium RIFCSPLOWO2_02_FULL_67_36]OFW20550.1 MAG: hypothetical protein A3G21_23310 [Acidobacteria bacterium RIFCSPLOWO2_12_FULL_66_21]